MTFTIEGDLSGGGNDFGKTGGGTLIMNGSVLIPEFEVSEGTLGGSGNFQNLSLSFNSALAPGNSAGLITVAGDLEFVTGETNFIGTLHMELGGASRGTGYDAIDAGGIVSLNGSLVLTFLNSYQNIALAADVYTLIAGGSLTGEFDNVLNGERLETADGFGSFLVSYGEGSAFDPASLVISDFQGIPEPGPAALILTGGLAIGFSRRNARTLL
jgi:hypothetical protein